MALHTDQPRRLAFIYIIFLAYQHGDTLLPFFGLTTLNVFLVDHTEARRSFFSFAIYLFVAFEMDEGGIETWKWMVNRTRNKG